MKQRIKELKEQAKTDPTKAEELKNIQQQKKQKRKTGSPPEASMADSNQGDQPEMSGKTLKEQEPKPEKTRAEQMIQVISELFEQLQAEKYIKISPQKFYEVLNHQQMNIEDLTKSLKLLEHFIGLMEQN